MPLASFSFRWIAFAAARPPPADVDRGRLCCDVDRSLPLVLTPLPPPPARVSLPPPRSACGARLASSSCGSLLPACWVVAEDEGTTEDEGELPSSEGHTRRTSRRPDGGKAPAGHVLPIRSAQLPPTSPYIRSFPQKRNPRRISKTQASLSASAVLTLDNRRCRQSTTPQSEKARFGSPLSSLRLPKSSRLTLHPSLSQGCSPRIATNRVHGFAWVLSSGESHTHQWSPTAALRAAAPQRGRPWPSPPHVQPPPVHLECRRRPPAPVYCFGRGCAGATTTAAVGSHRRVPPRACVPAAEP